jgi:hypothetical protein
MRAQATTILAVLAGLGAALCLACQAALALGWPLATELIVALFLGLFPLYIARLALVPWGPHKGPTATWLVLALVGLGLWAIGVPFFQHFALRLAEEQLWAYMGAPAVFYFALFARLWPWRGAECLSAGAR